jgi:hypothetical protein
MDSHGETAADAAERVRAGVSIVGAPRRSITRRHHSGLVMTAAAMQTRWLSLHAAAELLGLTPAALRKSLDRRAMRRPDGGIEAEIDGVRGRKLGRLWRVTLSPAWTVSTPPRAAVASTSSQSVRDDREGTRS